MNTQDKIIDYLTRHKKATVPEISQLIGLTPQNIRHHLNTLIRKGLICKTDVSIKQGKGRPIAVYEVNSNLRSNNLALLSACLLDNAMIGINETDRQIFFQSLSTDILANSASIPQSRNLTRRINDTINRLTELNYSSRWEAHASGPRIILGNCPYAPIIKNHPELCLMDKEILQSLLSCEVVQVAQIDQNPKGSPVCIFRLIISPNTTGG